MHEKLYTMRLFGFQLRTILMLLGASLLGLVGLGLDLMNDGLVDEFLWNVTGETEPEGQILGGLQYASNWTRATPELDKTAEIKHIPANPFGINAFLELEADPANRERSMAMIDDVGFGWLRQQVTWEDIEIHNKGDFEDRRVDRNKDGVIDAEDVISSWEKYDHIVELAQAYDIQIIARVGGPTPSWALAEGVTNVYSPPANTQDFVEFAVAVAERYHVSGVKYYQIWNEPNLYPEWGDQNIDPVGYADLLCRTHDALKAIDPDIVILTGAIGPTIDLTGVNAYDVLFLQRFYDAGGGECFDILTAQGYGLFSGPTDQRLRPFTVNYGRNQWLRDVMVQNGDAHKPIWLSEAAWNPVPNDPAIRDWENYGRVSPEEAAEYAPLAYDRAIHEWPWVGVVNYWFFKRPNEDEINASWYYFRIVEPDWTPTPTYYALQEYIASDEWRTEKPPWEERSRELIPYILTLGLGVLFTGYILVGAVLDRLFPPPENI